MVTLSNTKKTGGLVKKNNVLLKQLLMELSRHFENGEETAPSRLTKSQALVKTMVDNAVSGNERMLANVLKLADKLDAVTEETAQNTEHSKAQWELMFAFFGKYKPLIEREIERRKAIDPAYWAFDWFRPEAESAPWHGQV